MFWPGGCTVQVMFASAFFTVELTQPCPAHSGLLFVLSSVAIERSILSSWSSWNVQGNAEAASPGRVPA